MLNSRFFVFVAAVASAAKFRDSTSDASPNAIELMHVPTHQTAHSGWSGGTTCK